MPAVDSGGAGGYLTGSGGCWKRVRLILKTPPVHQYFRGRKSKSGHDLMIVDGKGQPTPKRWKRLRAGNGRDGHLLKGLSDTYGLRHRDAVPDEWEKAGEGLQSSISRFGVGRMDGLPQFRTSQVPVVGILICLHSEAARGT